MLDVSVSAAADDAAAPSRDLVGLPDGLVICSNPECYLVCEVTPSRRGGRAFCSRACQRRVTYLLKVSVGRCVHCNDPVAPGGACCEYHRQRTRLRDAMHSARQRPATPERDAALAKLRAEYDALAAARRVAGKRS